ncbi:hypothetical protein [Corallococcus llansteffanensis]|uniref:hypothetical protein n=1 Tax=Corallococcus llansteffanensis TaxID=2316731 RepID=UPI001ABFF1FE|nr:hypothetical protein [Corallococcus llansteffanensis]
MSRRSLSRAALAAVATLFSVGCGPIDAEPSADTLVTRGDALSSVWFHYDFRADNFSTNSQCNNGVNVAESKRLGEWTTRVKLDTDSRGGGCLQTFGVQDPASELSGLALFVEFRGEANLSGDGQCDTPGLRAIPVTPSGPSLASAWGIDTDQRYKGCVQTLSLTGRSDVALDVKFEDQNYNGQCGNTGLHTVTSTHPVSIVMDMDDRAGGCLQSFRLRKLSCGDGVCDAGEACEADCSYCGDGVCNSSETQLSCGQDCGGSYCGDGVCDVGEFLSCLADCGGGPVCGDGLCDPSEFGSCSLDCGGIECIKNCSGQL